MTATRTAVLVRDVMTTDPATVWPGDSATEVARVLDANQISGVPVIDDQERVIGVVSKTDLMHLFLEGPDGAQPTSVMERLAEQLGGARDELDPDSLGVVEDFMSTELVTASPDEPVGAVARRLSQTGVHRAIVVDEELHLLGIITALDLLRVFPA